MTASNPPGQNRPVPVLAASPDAIAGTCQQLPPESHKEQRQETRFAQLITELRASLKRTYKGRIKRKLPIDHFVWLERFDGENTRDNFVLFPEWAPWIWDDLNGGDWVQVTRVAPDPYGRNTRALNAGLAVDLQPFDDCLGQLQNTAEERGGPALQALARLRAMVTDLPDKHPLREYFNPDTLAELARLSEGTPTKPQASQVAQKIRDMLPEFVYLSDLSGVSDSVSIRSLTQGPTQEAELLLASLAKIVGLQPAAVVQENVVDRKKVLGDKSGLLTRRLGEHWFKDDLALEFDKDGQRLSLWISSGGSGDPPSRRSKGLGWYVSLLAKFAQLSTQRNILVLLDDPGVYLHPVAQRQLLPVLDSQPFQVLLSTHLPFMIDPDHLERIRVVKRTVDGTRVSEDWDCAKEDLLPVWGSLTGTYLGSLWLIVEGPRDKSVFSRMSTACAANGLSHVTGIPIVPGGGGHVIHLVTELAARGIPLVVVLDGDQAGREMKANVAALGSGSVRGVLTLDELGLTIKDPEIEDLFLTDELQKALSRNERDLNDQKAFSSDTLKVFARLFARVRELSSAGMPPNRALEPTSRRRRRRPKAGTSRAARG